MYWCFDDGSVGLRTYSTISNIKAACKHFFNAEDMECNIFAGERGPSWTETKQITNWKTLRVCFIERSEERIMCEKLVINDSVT